MSVYILAAIIITFIFTVIVVVPIFMLIANSGWTRQIHDAFELGYEKGYKEGYEAKVGEDDEC